MLRGREELEPIDGEAQKIPPQSPFSFLIPFPPLSISSPTQLQPQVLTVCTAPPFISLNFFSGCLIILSYWISDLVENENGRMMSPMETERNPNYTAVFWLGIWSCLFLWTFCSTPHHQLSFRYKSFFKKMKVFYY